MRVVITGGAGFLGSRLARAILERGALTDSRGQSRPIRELVLLDVVAPARVGREPVATRTPSGASARTSSAPAFVPSRTSTPNRSSLGSRSRAIQAKVSRPGVFRIRFTWPPRRFACS